MHKTLVVVDGGLVASQFPFETIDFETYLREYPKLNEPRIRVINLCDTEQYLSQGYYCSLLAEARNHEVLPSVRVINALRSEAQDDLFFSGKLFAQQMEWEGECYEDVVCMGEVADARFKKIAADIYRQYPAPLLKVALSRTAAGVSARLCRCSFSECDAGQQAFCLQVMNDYAKLSWRKRGGAKKYRWDLAILVNPEEDVPPSNTAAISRFIKAGEKLGIRTQVVTADALRHINQYDGLFIRETTAIDHDTYRLACEAEKKGLVVIDDPNSILRCCNKVFLHDAFNYKKVPSLKTLFVSDSGPQTVEMLEQAFSYPLVLKMPEGSFSKGVFKAESRTELLQLLKELLAQSALVLAQEYLFTDYDWRIGMLNGRALYACRYYMARNHWQIYNHGSKRYFSGGFDTLPTFEAPRAVLEAAHKAAAAVGNGLYGIDIKELDGRAYVIEVNDNPNIDQGIEDKYLGEELYMQIMSEFLRRFELRGR